MKQNFEWLLKNVGEPKWWEETGHPRYCDFAPDKIYDIYADQVVLLLIACQVCGERSKGAVSWAALSGQRWRLSELIKLKSLRIGYGDPPNVGCCPAGATMGSETIRVIEFWEKNEDFEWVRLPELEVDLRDVDSV